MKAKLALGALGVALAAVVYVAVTQSNGETRYKRPGPNAGAQAQEFWDYFWVGTLRPGTGDPNANRCYFPLIGAQAPTQPPVPGPCDHTKSCTPHAPAASGYFSPAIFACAATPDGCYVDQAGTQQPIRKTKIGYVYGIGSAHGACIVGNDGACYGLVDQCPIQPSTPTPVVSPTPTRSPVPTSGTPVPITGTPTPAMVCVTITPKP